MPGARARLDHPAFAGRLRTAQSRRSAYERRVVISDIRRPAAPLRASVTAPKPAVTAQLKPKHKPAVARLQPNSVPSRQQRSQVLMRQLASPKKPRSKRFGLRYSLRSMALTGLAGVLFVFGVGVGLAQLNTNKQVEAQVKTLAAQTTSDDGSLPDGGVPSEDRPGGGAYWHPRAQEPKRIRIPSLGVDARVLKVGVKSNGEVKTTANIFDTGWLETSARPGEQGAMFIDGHVHGPTQPGVFFGIKKLQPGDKIYVERGDGTMFTYSVVKTETYSKDKVDMVAGLNPVVPGKPGLNLITCDGSYDTEGHYDQRLIVFATQD